MSAKSNGSSSLKLLKNLCCASCNLQFYIKDFTLKGSRCPFLLHCGHSVCETCLQQSLKAMKCITCQHCNSVITLGLPEPINQCFPISVYGIGSLVIHQNSRQEMDKRLHFLTKKDGNFNYAFKEQSNVMFKAHPSDNICEECSLTALWYCENCKSNFCEICWTRVHGSARSLMKHTKTAICKAEMTKRPLKKCPAHENQDLEFYCKGCSTTVCSHCVILQHQGEGHNPVTLKEKNVEIISKVMTAAEEAEKINKRMRHTLEKIKLIQNSPDNNLFSDLENQIRRNFCRIHGILQLEEERLLNKIQDKSKERENCIKALRIQLEKQIENVEILLREYEIAVKKPQSGDLTELHRQLDEVQDLPCYLISPKSGDSEAKLTFNESLIKLLQIYCTIDFSPNETFELRSSSNLPDGYAVESLNVSDCYENMKFLPKGRQDFSISDIETSSDGSSRDLTKKDLEVSEPAFTKESKIFIEKTSYSVRVTYIKNPGEFYVTLNSQRPKQQAIDKRASQLANFSSVVPKIFAKDDIYLVKYNVDKKWYRARIIEIYPSESSQNEESLLVYYIDYGNSETVPASRLRPIPSDMLEEPPLAIKCKLFDCVPKKESWCAESTKIMEKILNNYTATMFVMKAHRDCLEVDLSVMYPEGQIGRDIVSVRDALLFLEFSNFVHGSKIPLKSTAFKYLPQCLPSIGETFEAVITHVNSPSDFYVQKMKQDSSYLLKLTSDLQNYYGENLERGIIYNPVIGMPCAALFSADRKWYRAKIVEVPGKKMVTVFYVDYGNKETITWTRIRKLKECFVKRPPLALNCALAGIFPAEDTWSLPTKSYFEKCVMMKNCRIYIHEKPKSKQKLRVLLHKRVKGKDICVNNLLVDMGLASKSSPNCLWMLKTDKDKGEIESPKPDSFPSYADADADERKSKSEVDDDQGILNAENISPNNEILKTRKKRSKLSAKELRDLHEYEKKYCEEEVTSTEDAEDEVDEYNNVFKIKIKILSAESPACIYVTFAALMDEFKNLQSKLNDFYQNSSPAVTKEWTVDSICAVFDSAYSCWYRASVLCPLSNGQIKVFLKDIAQVRTEPVSALRELDSSFTKCATCAVKCHLADIRPAGKQWPSISCEYLLNELDNYSEIYMTKKGQIENRSLPVELWVQKIVPRGALEPITKEWITLNRLLVNQGLAVPTKPKIWYESISVNCGDNSDGENEEGDNQERNIDDKGSDTLIPSLNSQWMPPEPLKRQRFVGIPTYVDFDAFIHIYDIEEDGKKLKTINETLLKEYGNSEPDPEDQFWGPGQLCIAKYHADNLWYRGLLLQANENFTYEVLFVDYGNVETCHASDLRKRIKMHEIPILSHKFQLHGIVPTSEDGKWPVSVIDVLHSLVVDKKCEINILKMPLNSSETYFISLKIMEDDLEVPKYLVDQGLASFEYLMNGSSDSDGSYSDDSVSLGSLKPKKELKNDLNLFGYVRLCIPDNCDEFFVEVTAVISETEFFANIVEDESLSANLKKVLKEFKSLQEELTEKCHLQPLLEKLIIGQPCCCVHPKNNKWCRGEIVRFLQEENSVCVFYVDYGNQEFLSKDLLHECKNEWMNLPKMALKFRLANIKKCPNVSKSVYMKALTSCFQHPLFAEILNRYEEVLEVKLSDKKSGSLAYQGMIDQKLMTFS